MLINSSNLTSIFQNIKTTFSKAFDAAPSQWQEVAMLVPSSSRSNDYKWLSDFPRMRKWVGDKMVKALEAFKYTVGNDDFEATVEVKRNDIEDDQLGEYKLKAEAAGESAKQLPDELVFSLIAQGFSAKCYDGQYYFDTDHPVGDTVFSNKGTAKLSITTQAAAMASYGAARAAMKKMKDAEGRPLNVNPNVLLVPPALEDIATALMSAERLEDGKTNIYRNTAKVVSAAWLTDDNAWFLLDTRKALKPFFYQERKKPVFVSATDLNNPDVFGRGVFKFGAEARGAAGYGLPQLAYGSDGSA